VVTRDSLDRRPTEEIKPVVGLCDNLSSVFPDEFGFAYGVRDVAVLGIATDRGQDLYDKWRSDRGLPADTRPEPEGKFIPALNDQAPELAGKPVQLERVGRSRAQVEALQHRVDWWDPTAAQHRHQPPVRPSGGVTSEGRRACDPMYGKHPGTTRRGASMSQYRIVAIAAGMVFAGVGLTGCATATPATTAAPALSPAEQHADVSRCLRY
jgi:hypothetical protein